jgi:hypothetical protein
MQLLTGFYNRLLLDAAMSASHPSAAKFFYKIIGVSKSEGESRIGML